MKDEYGNCYDPIISGFYNTSKPEDITRFNKITTFNKRQNRDNPSSSGGDSDYVPYKTERSSPDIHEIEEVSFKCPKLGKTAYANLVYVNSWNNQAYLCCQYCCYDEPIDEYRITCYHSIKGKRLRYDYPDFFYDKHGKVETDLEILDYLEEHSGSNRYELCKALGFSKDKVRRSIKRLKELGFVSTRKVGKAIRIYPNFSKMGRDFTKYIDEGEEREKLPELDISKLDFSMFDEYTRHELQFELWSLRFDKRNDNYIYKTYLEWIKRKNAENVEFDDWLKQIIHPTYLLTQDDIIVTAIGGRIPRKRIAA